MKGISVTQDRTNSIGLGKAELDSLEKKNKFQHFYMVNKDKKRHHTRSPCPPKEFICHWGEKKPNFGSCLLLYLTEIAKRCSLSRLDEGRLIDTKYVPLIMVAKNFPLRACHVAHEMVFKTGKR